LNKKLINSSLSNKQISRSKIVDVYTTIWCIMIHQF
jgi:hypothetical protein